MVSTRVVFVKIALVALALLGEARQFRRSDGSGDPPAMKRLAFKHMTRTGGFFIKGLLEGVMGNRSHYIDEFSGLSDERRGDAFVIAGVRNPCDYYASLYAQDSETVHARFSMADGGSSFFEKGNRNPTKFSKWLAFIQGEQHSIMSLRYWETLMAKKDGLSCYWGEELHDCHKKFDSDSVEHDLASFSPDKTADCWVHTENLMNDLEECLVRYEAQSGAPLNWAVFAAFRSGARGDPKAHRKSTRLSCKHYYDNETAASVMRTDRHLFEVFGYSECCGSATSEARPLA